MNKQRNYLQLHFIVFLSGLIPVIAIEIELPSVEIVFYRTLIAIIVLIAVLRIKKKSFKIDKSSFFKLLFAGFLTAIFWGLIIVSAKTSNASVCLVGLATNPLWVSFLHPLFQKKKIKRYQVILGIVTVLGVYVIVSHSFSYGWGLLIAIIAAFFGALLTIINAKLSPFHSHYTITLYQMLGACLCSLCFLPFYLEFFSDGTINIYPSPKDFAWIFGLAVIFSVYAYSVFIKVMKHLTPFSVSLTSNLSTIYGILTALLLSSKTEKMNVYFYLGAAIISASVVALPLYIYYKTHYPNKKMAA